MSEESSTSESMPVERRTGGEVIPEWLLRLKERTPARVLVGRSGPAYRTETHLTLKADHAAARDAVHAELDLARDLGRELAQTFDLFEVQTCARDKQEYLVRPDLGRQLSEESKELLRDRCPPKPDFQIVLGDGLSATALAKQGPVLLPLLMEGARAAGWRVGQPFVIRYCRVGVLNDIGAVIDPAVVVLLVGERPGLITAESLSAYMAYRPRPGDTDAQRNLISNIHSQGVGADEACRRILALAAQMTRRELSGVAVKEELPSLAADVPPSQRQITS